MSDNKRTHVEDLFIEELDGYETPSFSINNEYVTFYNDEEKAVAKYRLEFSFHEVPLEQ